MQYRIQLQIIGALVLILALHAPNAFAQKTWVGGNNANDWHTAANWSPSGVPASTDAVIFNLQNSSVVIATAVTVASLQVNANVNVGMTANATLTVTGATSLGVSAKIDLAGSAATLLQLNGAVSFSPGNSNGDPTQIWSSVATAANGVRVVKFGPAATLSMGDLQSTFFGTGVNVWITRDTGFLSSSVRFEDDITLDGELNPGAHNIWLGKKADILRSGYNNQTQNFLSFSNSITATGMVYKNINYWQDTNGSYLTGAGYFNWEVGVTKIAAIRVDVNYARYDLTWSGPSATEPFRAVGVRAVNLEHPANQATNKYEFYWVVQPIGLWQDNGLGFAGSTTPYNDICYEVEFHPGYIQGSPQHVQSARYSDNVEQVGVGGGSWYSDGSVQTSTNVSGRIFVPQCPAYGFGDITIGTGTDPVPVELTAFSARYIDGMVRLNWQTATEINNFGFAVERSTDGEGWEEVGFVPGFGNSSSPKSYSFEDVLAGDLLRVPQLAYRLRQMDRDGTTDFSNIVFVTTGELPERAELYAAYPNPFNPTTTISFAIKNAATVTLKVYNTFGQEVATLLASSAMDAGLHTVPFSGEQLPSGVYMAVLEADGALQQQKLVLNK